MSVTVTLNGEILDGIAAVRMIFEVCGLEAPSVILLKSHEEGEKFLCEIRRNPRWFVMTGDQLLGKTIEMADGSMWMEFSVIGISVRWPANRIATPDGSWSWG